MKIKNNRKFNKDIRKILTMLALALTIALASKTAYAAPLVEEEVTSEGKPSYDDVTKEDEKKEKGNTQNGEAKVDNSKGGTSTPVKPDPIKEPDKTNPTNPDYNPTDNKKINPGNVVVDKKENPDEKMIKTPTTEPTPTPSPTPSPQPKTSEDESKVNDYLVGGIAAGTMLTAAEYGVYRTLKRRKRYSFATESKEKTK